MKMFILLLASISALKVEKDYTFDIEFDHYVPQRTDSLLLKQGKLVLSTNSLKIKEKYNSTEVPYLDLIIKTGEALLNTENLRFLNDKTSFYYFQLSSLAKSMSRQFAELSEESLHMICRRHLPSAYVQSRTNNCFVLKFKPNKLRSAREAFNSKLIAFLSLTPKYVDTPTYSDSDLISVKSTDINMLHIKTAKPVADRLSFGIANQVGVALRDSLGQSPETKYYSFSYVKMKDCLGEFDKSKHCLYFITISGDDEFKVIMCNNDYEPQESDINLLVIRNTIYVKCLEEKINLVFGGAAERIMNAQQGNILKLAITRCKQDQSTKEDSPLLRKYCNDVSDPSHANFAALNKKIIEIDRKLSLFTSNAQVSVATESRSEFEIALQAMEAVWKQEITILYQLVDDEVKTDIDRFMRSFKENNITLRGIAKWILQKEVELSQKLRYILNGNSISLAEANVLYIASKLKGENVRESLKEWLRIVRIKASFNFEEWTSPEFEFDLHSREKKGSLGASERGSEEENFTARTKVFTGKENAKGSVENNGNAENVLNKNVLEDFDFKYTWKGIGLGLEESEGVKASLYPDEHQFTTEECKGIYCRGGKTVK